MRHWTVRALILFILSAGPLQAGLTAKHVVRLNEGCEALLLRPLDFAPILAKAETYVPEGYELRMPYAPVMESEGANRRFSLLLVILAKPGQENSSGLSKAPITLGEITGILTPSRKLQNLEIVIDEYFIKRMDTNPRALLVSEYNAQKIESGSLPELLKEVSKEDLENHLIDVQIMLNQAMTSEEIEEELSIKLKSEYQEMNGATHKIVVAHLSLQDVVRLSFEKKVYKLIGDRKNTTTILKKTSASSSSSLRRPVMTDEWDDLVELLLEEERPKEAAEVLESENEVLYQHLLQAAARPEWRFLWGKSRNHDKNVNQRIIDPKILRFLAPLLNYDELTQDPAHAGALHTYGYLFSTLDTPYGKKRDRWTQGEIDAGFGFQSKPFSPTPKEGTLLTNLSYFAGRIALEGALEKRQLESLKEHVSKELVEFDWKSLSIDKIEESFLHPKDPSRKITLVTHLVPFKHPNSLDPMKPSFLLIYSFKEEGAGYTKSRLLTVFPVAEKVAQNLLLPGREGSEKEFQVRYNAVIDGIDHGTILKGERNLFRSVEK